MNEHNQENHNEEQFESLDFVEKTDVDEFLSDFDEKETKEDDFSTRFHEILEELNISLSSLKERLNEIASSKMSASEHENDGKDLIQTIEQMQLELKNVFSIDFNILNENLSSISENITFNISEHIETLKKDFSSSLLTYDEHTLERFNSIIDNLNYIKNDVANINFEFINKEICANFSHLVEQLEQFKMHFEAKEQESEEFLNSRFLNFVQELDNFKNLFVKFNPEQIANEISEKSSLINDSIVQLTNRLSSSVFNISDCDNSDQREKISDASLVLLLNNLDEIKEKNEEQLKEIQNSVNLKIMSLLENLSDLKSDLNMVCKRINSCLNPRSDSSIDIQSVQFDLVEDLKKEISELNLSLKDFQQNNFAQILSCFQDLKDRIEKENLSEDHLSKFNKLLESFSEKIDVANSSSKGFGMLGLESFVEEFRANFSTLKKFLGNEIIDKYEEFYKSLEHFKNVEFEKLFMYLSEIKDTIQIENKNDLLSLQNSIFELKHFLDQNKTEQLNEFSEKFNTIKNNFDQTIESQKKQFEQFKASFDQIDTSICSKITNEILQSKDNLITLIASFFENISFIEETQMLQEAMDTNFEQLQKGFNSARCEIADTLKPVNASLKNIEVLKQKIDRISEILTKPGSEIEGYAYSLLDLESDITKLNVLLRDFDSQNKNSFKDVTETLLKFSNVLEDLSKKTSVKQEVDLLIQAFDGVSEDIASISKRTNKLIISADDAQKNYDKNNNELRQLVDSINSQIHKVAKYDKRFDSLSEFQQNTLENTQALNDAFFYLGNWVDVAGSTIEEISENIISFKEHFEHFEKNTEKKFQEINGFANHFEGLSEKLDASNFSLQGLHNDFGYNFESLGEKLDASNFSLQELQNRLNHIASDVENLKKFDNLLKSSEHNSEHINLVLQQVAENQEIFDSQQRSIAKIEEKLENFSRLVNKINLKLSNDDEGKDIISSRIERIENRLAKLDEKLGIIVDYINDV